MKNTLFQVSTVAATIEGVIKGDIAFNALFKEGDFGLGTFDRIDGELVAFDGNFYQCTYDGSIKPVEASLKTPFAQLTFFVPQKKVKVSTDSFQDFDHKLPPTFENGNIFHAVKIEGLFDSIRLRLPKPVDQGGLKEIVASQRAFSHSSIEGVAVGFWTPNYLDGISVGGFHFHFLSQDRTIGGHVLNLAFSNLDVQIQPLPNYHIAMPGSSSFSKAHLDQDFRSLLRELEKD